MIILKSAPKQLCSLRDQIFLLYLSAGCLIMGAMNEKPGKESP